MLVAPSRDHVRNTFDERRKVTILSGWQEQYERMLRSHRRLKGIAGGQLMASSDEARDALLLFFQDAYHLKDWIKNDPSVSTSDVEEFINAAGSLQICADLCNGTKHLVLQRSRTGDSSTAFTTQSVTVRPATIGPGRSADAALHGWTVESMGQSYEAVDLANSVLSEWRSWLGNQELV